MLVKNSSAVEGLFHMNADSFLRNLVNNLEELQHRWVEGVQDHAKSNAPIVSIEMSTVGEA
jgi:hypothetical protein